MKQLLILVLLFAGNNYLSAQTRDINYYLDLATTNSPLLKDYYGQIEISQLDSLIRKAAYKPQIDLKSTAVYTPVINGRGYDGANQHSYNALLSLNKTIIGGKNMKTQMAVYELERQSLNVEKKVSERDLRLTIITQYINTYAIWEEITYYEQVLTLLRDEEVILKKLTESSIYKQTDYLNFRVGLQQQQLLIIQQRANYKNNIALLNYLCGIVATSDVELKTPEIILYSTTSFESTPQFHKFQIDSLKLVNSDKLIDYNYRPKLSAFVDAGYSSYFVQNPYKNFGASVGLTLSVPIFDGRQRAQQHNKIKISEQIRSNYQYFSKNQYRQQFAQLLQQLGETEKVIDQAQGLIKYSQTLMEAYHKQLLKGEVSITDYIISVNNYINTKQIITQNENIKLQIINQINYWNNE